MTISGAKYLNQFKGGVIGKQKVVDAWLELAKDGKVTKSEVKQQVDTYDKLLLGDDPNPFVNNSTTRITKLAQHLQCELESAYESGEKLSALDIRTMAKDVNKFWVGRNRSSAWHD